MTTLTILDGLGASKTKAVVDLGSGALADQVVLYDSTATEVLGVAIASPAANTVLDRLKTVATLLTATNGYVDGIETLLGTANALLAAATPAGELHIGNVSNPAAVIVNAVPTVTVGAYATGQVVGALLSFGGVSRLAAGDGLAQEVLIYCKSAQTTAFDVVLFHTSPTASTFTNAIALTVNAADFDKVLGVVHLSDWTNLGGVSVAQAINLARPYKVGAGTTIYGVLVARSAPTLASVSDITVSLKVLPN
jgi:hypothetical protein